MNLFENAAARARRIPKVLPGFDVRPVVEDIEQVERMAFEDPAAAANFALGCAEATIILPVRRLFTDLADDVAGL